MKKGAKIAIVLGIMAFASGVGWLFYASSQGHGINPHLINGSDARVYRYDANSSYDAYYVTYAIHLDSTKTFIIPLNGVNGLYGNEIFERSTWNNTAFASKVNLTVSQLTCANGTHRIIWGAMKTFGNEYGMFLCVNGTWYERVINTIGEINVCIAWAFNNTILMEANTTPA